MAQYRTIRDRARFLAPYAARHEVRRDRLDHRYQQASGKVLRILAPGGYGKSTIAARWVATDERAVRWIDLEPVDNDPVALLATLGRALDGLVERPLESLPTLSADRPEFDAAVVGGLARLIGSCRRPFVLVLDDVHHLDDPSALKLVVAMIEHLPADSTIVLLGRAQRPVDEIGRLRLRPGVVDVTIAELSLTEDETAKLLADVGAELDGGQVAALARRLEGWPAGLRLAGLVMSDGRTPSSLPLEDIEGTVPFVDYLRSEWTGQLGGDDLAFLRAIACLDRFTGELSDRVLGRADSAEMIERLHRERLLVVPFDVRADWFRMHPVLARWLENDLRASDPRAWRQIHLRASTHWEREGDIDLAFQHASKAEDLDRCEHLVTQYSGLYFTRGMLATVERWLATFPPERRSSSPSLVLVSGTARLYHDPPTALRWGRVLQRIAEGDDASRAAEAAIWADLLMAALDPVSITDVLPRAERAHAAMPSGPWRAFACMTLGGQSFLVGDDDRALAALEEGAFEAERVGAWMQRANCLGLAAIVLDDAGGSAAAEPLGRAARRILRSNDDTSMPTTAGVVAINALLEARDGHWPSARAELEIARGHLAIYRSTCPWFNVMCRLPLVAAAVRVADVALARVLVRELEHHARFEPANGPVRARVIAARRRVDASTGWPDPAGTLTAAELRVLHHLPTNLSLAAIAERLYVSRNTVKSQTAAIYRKLGAGSRGEAVDLARLAGLLDDRGPDLPPPT